MTAFRRTGYTAVWFCAFFVMAGLQCPDADMDFIGDDLDNCSGVANTVQADSDSDGSGDACDNCPTVSNSDQADGDDDGVGDICDNCPGVANSDQPDGDDDGVGDACDNCPNVANTNQADANDDGTGDICEILDLAMGDESAAKVYIYYNVRSALALGQQPDVVLNDTTSMISAPVTLDIADNRLFVANRANDTVVVFNDFLSLSNNQAPDIVLNTAGSGIQFPFDLQVYDNDLYVVNRFDDTIRIFRNVGSLTTGKAPDAVLSSNSPEDLVVAGNILYVANVNAGSVSIYNDAGGLNTGHVPDVTLTYSGSLIQMPRRLHVFDNVLYVVQPDVNRLLAFSPADGLSNNDPPIFTLGAISQLNSATCAAVVGGRLYLSNSFSASEADLLGFGGPPELLTGERPDVTLDQVSPAPREIVGVLGTLWTTSATFDCINGWLDAGAMTQDQPPDIVLIDPTMSQPSSLVVRERP